MLWLALRNMFYGDANRSTVKLGFGETTVADDYNSWKGYKTRSKDATQVDTIYQELRATQKELNAWGRTNEVVFDPARNLCTIYTGDGIKAKISKSWVLYSTARSGWQPRQE